jgi:drug/metabolite transporter (DMT)-like permease
MRIKPYLTLFLVAAIWGGGFIAQRLVASQMGPFLFNGLRFLLAVLCLWILSGFKVKIQKANLPMILLAGGALFGGSTLQQVGIRYTTAGNAGFITGMYVVIIPLFLVLFWKEKFRWQILVAALLAAFGLGLLSFSGSLKINPGDALELGGAFLWALHVILVGKAVKKMDLVEFSIGQYLIVGLLDLMIASIFENSTMSAIPSSIIPILYGGIVSIGIGFTLQAKAQIKVNPSSAALILSLEALFAATFGFLVLGEKLHPIQWVGGILILAGIALAQLQPQSKAAILETSEMGK